MPQCRGRRLLHDGDPVTGRNRVLGEAATGDRGSAVVDFVMVGGLLTIGWTMRAYRNLPALAVGDLRYGVSWALLGWITPGLSCSR